MNRFAKLLLVVALAVTAFGFVSLDQAEAGCYYTPHHISYAYPTFYAPTCYYTPTYGCNYGYFPYYGCTYGYHGW